ESGHRRALRPSCRVPDLFFGYHCSSEALGRLGTMASIPATQFKAQGAPVSQSQIQSDLPEERDRFIPVRKSDLLDALIDHGALASDAERDTFRRFWRQLASIYHYLSFDQLEKLRDDYYYFSPELSDLDHLDVETLERLHAEFDETLTDVLKEANFIEV